MSAASNYLENKILDHVLKFGNGSLTVNAGSGYAPPATLYLALYTASPGEAGSHANEVLVGSGGTATGYVRQSVTFATAASGASATNATVTFPTATYNFGTISHVAVVDSATAAAGNVLFYGAVTTSKTIETGDTFQVSSGNLTISLD
jgi:hypothetical protein